AVSWKSGSMFVQAEGTLDKASLTEKIPNYQVRRSYTDDADLFHVGGKTYALTKMWGNRTIEAIEAIKSVSPSGCEIDFEPHGTAGATFKDYVITRLNSGSIKLERNGLPVEPAHPELRRLAEELDVPTASASGNPYNTQALGRHLIKK